MFNSWKGACIDITVGHPHTQAPSDSRLSVYFPSPRSPCLAPNYNMQPISIFVLRLYQILLSQLLALHRPCHVLNVFSESLELVHM